MSKRCFLGIPVHSDQRDLIAPDSLPDADGIRIVPPSNWHLTLLFMGEVDEDHLPQLIEEVAALRQRHQAFSLRWKELRLVHRHDGGMIWAELQSSPQWTELVEDARENLSHFGTHQTKSLKPIPHLTLARFKQPMLFEPLSLGGECPVKELVLYESVLGEKGSRYSPIASFGLSSS